MKHGAVWRVQLSQHAPLSWELPGEHAAIRGALGAEGGVLAIGAELFDEVFYTADDPSHEGCALIQVDNAAWSIGKNHANP